jgi:hypothetical protein
MNSVMWEEISQAEISWTTSKYVPFLDHILFPLPIILIEDDVLFPYHFSLELSVA